MTSVRSRISEEQAVDTCRHHWVIDAANGPTSRGRCKRCGEERDFFNNPEDALIPREEHAASR
jgi:hypothetical protein